MSREAVNADAVGESQRTEISGFLLQALASYINSIEPEPEQELSYSEFDALSFASEGFTAEESAEASGIDIEKIRRDRRRLQKKLELDSEKSPKSRMKNAIRKAHKFGYLPDPKRIQEPFPGDLSSRQAQVIWLGANGYGIREIAVALGLSEHTVKTHTDKATSMLGARNPLHATSVAIEDNQISSLSVREVAILLPLIQLHQKTRKEGY